MSPGDALRALAGYVRAHPTALVKAATDARRLRFGIPIRALRWAAAQGASAPGAPAKKGAPKDIEILPTPPALKLAASVDAMGTPLRVTAAVRVEDVYLAPDTVRISIRVTNVGLTLLAESESPVAMLIKSGVLDLSKVANVVKVLPKRPPFIVEAGGDRIVLDLLKVPSLARNDRVRKVLGVVSPLVGIRSIETDGEHLYVTLRATPSGLRDAVAALRAG
jgi:hypothetical protein